MSVQNPKLADPQTVVRCSSLIPLCSVAEKHSRFESADLAVDRLGLVCLGQHRRLHDEPDRVLPDDSHPGYLRDPSPTRNPENLDRNRPPLGKTTRERLPRQDSPPLAALSAKGSSSLTNSIIPTH